MRDYDNIVRDRQKAVRREIERRDLSIKAIHLDAEWDHDSTLLSYFPADEDRKPALMSVGAFYRLLKTKALPLDMLSMLLPDEYVIVRKPAGIDHDEIDDAMRDYVDTKAKAHHPDSPAGREISDCEDAELRVKLALVAGGRA